MVHDHVAACCTASFFHSFDSFSKDQLKVEIKSACETALRSRKALVHAYTTAAQTIANKALEESGFIKVMDVEDYKYPTESRRLYLWAYDLNIMRIAANNAPPAITPPVNPFTAPPVPARPVAPPVNPFVAPVDTRQRPRGQDGRFLPAIGVEFTVDLDRRIPQSWEGWQFDIFSPILNAWIIDLSRTRLSGYIVARQHGTIRRLRRVS